MKVSGATCLAMVNKILVSEPMCSPSFLHLALAIEELANGERRALERRGTDTDPHDNLLWTCSITRNKTLLLRAMGIIFNSYLASINKSPSL